MSIRLNVARSRRLRIGLALGLTAAGLAVISPADAAHPEVSLTGSDFEIDTDANIAQDDADPSIDWLTANTDNPLVVVEDEPSGQNDDSFGKGTKEDTEGPVVVDGSIPPNKSDLLEFGVYKEAETDGPGFLNLFWSRVQDPSGTTNMDFEFNKNKCVVVDGTPTDDSSCAANGVTPVRTAGDLLVVYELSKGGTDPELYLFTWLDGSEGIACEASNSFPCWGDRTDLDASGLAAGSINTTAVPMGTTVGGIDLGPYDPRTFGEAQIDLDAIFDSGACESFGSAYLKSRSSDSFPAALKDFIAPEPINLTNCGTVIVRKQTEPDGAEGSFGYTTVLDTENATNPSFSLSDDGVQTYNDVLFGTGYSVTEDSLATGFQLKSIDCSASSSGVSPSVSLMTATVSFDIDDPNDVVDCTFTNEALGTIVVEKQTDPDGDAQTFDFTGDASGTIGDGGTITVGNLSPGTYSSTETVPSGWDLTSISCDDGNSTGDTGTATATFELEAGETVTCTFTNTKRGAIVVEKQTNPDGAAGTFTFTGDASGSIGDGGTITVGNLVPGMYSSTESDPTNDGFRLDSIVCSDGNSSGDTGTGTATFNVEAGETVTCTFTNSTGAIEVTKTRKHAADGPGDHPHEGVNFTVNGVTKATDATGKACFENLVPGVMYDVVEEDLDGYAANPTQSVTVSAGATCSIGTPDAVSFHNTPLTNVTVSVDSQVVGGTASTIVCTDFDGNVSNGSTGEGGDGGLTVEDLPPTATADPNDDDATLTCVITVDP